MNDRSRIAVVLAAACLLLSCSGCGIANGRTERKLAGPGLALERFMTRGTQGIGNRLGAARRTLLALPIHSTRPRAAGDRAAGLAASTRDRVGSLGRSVGGAVSAIESWTGPRLRALGDTPPRALALDRDLRELGNDLRGADRVLGLRRQPLSDRTDWERRTDPDDVSRPVSWADRILRRFGL